MSRHTFTFSFRESVAIQPDRRRRYMHLAMRRHKSIAKVAMGCGQALQLTGSYAGPARNRKWREL
jgi:hypothetical protein